MQSIPAVHCAVQGGTDFQSLEEILVAQMKTTVQYVPVVLFIVLYKVHDSVHEIQRCDHLNKTIEQNFPAVLFIML